jgi:hypothetical protein
MAEAGDGRGDSRKRGSKAVDAAGRRWIAARDGACLHARLRCLPEADDMCAVAFLQIDK